MRAIIPLLIKGLITKPASNGHGEEDVSPPGAVIGGETPHKITGRSGRTASPSEARRQPRELRAPR